MNNQQMIFCSRCGEQFQLGANFCPRCAMPVNQQLPSNFTVQANPTPTNSSPTKRVGFSLGIGIFFMPYIFSWLTLQKGYSNLAKIVSLSWMGLVLLVNIPIIFNSNSRNIEPRNTTTLSSSTNTASAIPSTPTSSSLSATENLELGKKALSDGNLSTARSHLSAIPKDAKEFASAKQYLATVEKREKRKAVEDELNRVESEQAKVEEMLDATEDFSDEGTLKKGIYLNALKRKGELQLQRIKLERKLKGMP